MPWVLQEVREAHEDINLNVLRKASMVGMTTAGVASHQMLVRALDPRVLLLLQALEENSQVSWTEHTYADITLIPFARRSI